MSTYKRADSLKSQPGEVDEGIGEGRRHIDLREQSWQSKGWRAGENRVQSFTRPAAYSEQRSTN
jgi:hypothetical protein